MNEPGTDLAQSSLDYSLPRYLALLGRWTKRDFDAQYRRSALQALWAILQPFLSVAVYALIFGVIFKQTGGSIPYVAYIVSGVLVLQIVTNGLSSNGCLAMNYQIISHSSFPREIIPFSQVLGSFVTLLVTAVGMVVVAVVQGVRLRPMMLLVPIPLAFAVLLAAGVCVLASTIQVFVRDLQFAVPLISQALFFASPISYQPDKLPHWLQFLNTVNPISVDIEAVRDLAFRNALPSVRLFAIQSAATVAFLLATVAHLRSIQHRIVDLA